ncbi:MAG: lysylphosphatidylglycerol synthase domain-containing protein [Deferribacterota bacterium]|nr:lysylphosphatidylglycerol synthase domain-containing protein [Deferribacterota bacterium]
MLNRIINSSSKLLDNKNITILSQVISWTIGLIIAVFLFLQVDINIIKEAFYKAYIIPFIIIICSFVLFWLFFETYNLYLLIKYYGYKTLYKDILILRSATYLLMLINYNLGIGGILLGLSIKHKINIANSTSIVALYSLTDILSLSALTLISTAFICCYTQKKVYIILLIISFLLVLLLLFLYFIFHNSKLSKQFKNRIAKKIISFISDELSKLKKTDLLKIILLRMTYFLTFIIFFHFTLPLFHIHIPFIWLAALVPPIFFIGNLPITPAGIGTIQAAMLFFFKSFGQYEDILLFSICYTTFLLLTRLLLGLFSILFIDRSSQPLKKYVDQKN